MASQLDSLPMETLELIANHLAVDWKPSLYAFALASKRCRAAADTFRFSRINFKIISRKRLDRDISRWDSILQARSAFLSVRHLIIEGCLPCEEEDNGEMECLQENRYHGEDVDDLTLIYKRHGIIGTDCMTVLGTSQRDNEVWVPLSYLLRQFSGLKDLDYTGTLFPPSLLDVLHQYLPGCKLHLRSFRLKSLVVDVDRPRPIDEYEYKLATSPNLHSIIVGDNTWDEDARMNYNGPAAMCLTTGLAPNLEGIYMEEHYFGASPQYNAACLRRPPPWQGFFLDKTLDSYPRGCLRTLSLNPARIGYFLRWERQVDFSALQILHLWCVDLKTLATGLECQFSSLKTLVVQLRFEIYDAPQTFAQRMDVTGSAFLLHVAPLQGLHLEGCFAQLSFQAVLERHGGSLRKLAIFPARSHSHYESFQITPERIGMIQAHCTNVSDLGLRVPRSKGDRRELEFYRMLGAIPQLRDLSIELDSSQDRPEWRGPSRSSEKEKPPDHSLNRDMLMNFAVDESLARAMFRAVIANGSLIERLELESKKPYLNGLVEFSQVCDFMGRRWRCIRVRGSGARPPEDMILVQERGLRRRKQMERDDDEDALTGDNVKLGRIEGLFRSIWPARTETWKRDWHSFPLSLED